MVAKTIGDMNGRWAVLFRICLVLVPLAIATLTPWAVWITSNQFADNSFRGQGDRFTANQAEGLIALLTERVRREQTESHASLRADLMLELREHQQKPWHDVMDQRVTALERDEQIVTTDIKAINGKLDSLLVAVTELRSSIKDTTP